MKPYYEQDGVTIYHGDCREVLPFICADAIVTDWPYGVGVNYGSYEDTVEMLDSLIASTFPLLTGKSFARACFTCGILNQWRFPLPSWGLCLYSPNSNGSGPWGFTCWQPVLCYGKDPYLAAGLGRRPDAYLHMGLSKGDNGHPCPKPIALWKWVVNRCVLPGEVVCDPFMGSGTTLRAAKDVGLKAIGIEIEERYCEIAAQRLSQGVLDMFGEATA